ncbi:hypothetical protein THOM_1111 [Trachipleistophora hominis]|uniref:Uncharacterized protein n=1 Tax=Trachipleistophora hominis TaxID=72359 RepID=L7JWW6_TRAHO|nr:hypothetical protein THOM_1111 [Trachipleistophora hominis]
MYRYGLGANYYRPSRVKDDRVYDVESIPEINTEKYEKIMFEMGVYETAKKLASNNDKIQSNHPIVREIEELKEKIYRSDHELTFDQYRYFVNNYERIASEYDERRVEVTRTDLLKQIREIEALESTNPGLYKAVKPTYEAVKKWYEQNKNKNEITCHDFIRCRAELITSLEAAKEGKIVGTAGQGLNKELTPDNKRQESPPASDTAASKIKNTRRKQKKVANVFEKVFKGFYRWWLRVLHIARDESDDVQSRDVFEEIPNRTKLERKIPRSIDPSFGDDNQNLDESEEAEDENKYNRGRQREYIHEEL